jgi:hypothetical protein
MAKRDILKEAIADAKAVKETAIANAKAALEEAFTPQLKSMLSAKLEEMEIDEEKEDIEEKKKYKDDDRKDGGESKETKRTEKMKYGKDLAESDIDEEINLDEILAEIEEMDKKDIDEDAKTDAEEEGYEDGMEDEKEDMEDKDEEELDLEDMTDDDLKDFIEDVIADMVKSGELEAGESFEEEDEVDVDVEDEVDVEVTEGKKKKDDEKEDVKEEKEMDEAAVGTPGSGTYTKNNPYDTGEKSIGGDIAKALGDAASWSKEKLAALKQWSEDFEKNKKYASSGNKTATRPGSSGVGIYEKDEELEEAYSTIESLKSDLNEVNLLNAKLLYTNKIFKAKNLTESQKVKVLGAFDKAGTVKETKLVFETLNEGLKTKKAPIRESLGAASRVSGNVNKKKPIIKTDPMVARFQKLAGLK